MSELAKRVAVAAVGIPLVFAIAYLGGWYLAVLVSAFAALGALELFRMVGRVGVRPLSAVGAVGAAALPALAAWREGFAPFAPWAIAVVGGVCGVSIVGALRFRAPADKPLAAVAVTLFGTVYVGLSLSVVPLLRELPRHRAWADGGAAWAGLTVIALPLAATWIGDAAAYFAGKAWGRSKLAPSISPNKSWVGFWADVAGGGVAGALWHAIAAPLLPGLPFGVVTSVAVGMGLGLGAVLGDLAESLMKREAGVKDSGTFFPGHGGVLDRLDALFFTLPIAYAALAALGGGG